MSAVQHLKWLFLIKIFFIIFFFKKVLFVLSSSYIDEILFSSLQDYYFCSITFFFKVTGEFLEAFDQNFTSICITEEAPLCIPFIKKSHSKTTKFQSLSFKYNKSNRRKKLIELMLASSFPLPLPLNSKFNEL